MILKDLEGKNIQSNPLPTFNSMVNELLAEKFRLESRSGKGIHPNPNSSIFVVPPKPFFNSHNKSQTPVYSCSLLNSMDS